LAWNSELANNVNSLEKLKQYVSLTIEEENSMQEVLDNHPMNIPRYYLSLINPNDPNDPIRKLAIPTAEELVVAGQMGETTGDPYGDDKHNKGNGILHKYPYSALVVATEYCSMYCRHCFRKRLVGLPNDKTVENFKNAAKYIAEHKEITNVIISGGDPMMLPTKVIAKMLEALKDIDHINYVRIGVNPYYLYQCMPVSRVRHHFQVPLKRGVDIVSEAKRGLDGYAKRFKFIMGHDIGKIEICGRKDNILVMSQIHARPEHPEEASRILMGHLTENAGWLEDLDLMD
jgi:L-lysine 2,3-aminomutase